MQHFLIATRGMRVYPYPRIYPYPIRTRGSSKGRVNILRVRVGSGKQVTGTGIPEVCPWCRSKFNTTISGSESEDRNRQEEGLRQERDELDSYRSSIFNCDDSQMKPLQFCMENTGQVPSKLIACGQKHLRHTGNPE